MRTFVLAAAIAAAAVVSASPASASPVAECANFAATIPVTGSPTSVCAKYENGCVVVWTNQLQTTKPIEYCPI